MSQTARGKPCAQQWPGTLNPIPSQGRGKSTGPSQTGGGGLPTVGWFESKGRSWWFGGVTHNETGSRRDTNYEALITIPLKPVCGDYLQ
jgi:hypothetical protein